MSVDRFTLDAGIRVFLHDLHLSWARITRRAGLPGDLLVDGSAQLTVGEYYRFWEAVQEESDVCGTALEVGRAISTEAFSPVLLAALSSPTLRVAAGRISAYKPLIGPLVLQVQDGDAELRITCRWPDGSPPALLGLSELLFWVALARLGTRHEVRPVELVVPGAPHDLAAVEAYSGTRVRRGDLHAVSFRAADADRPFLTENEAMWQVFSPELGRRLADLQAGATTADRVRAALHETLPAGDSSIAGVTRKLAVSSRTLQRQLNGEGTSYQAVLSRTRNDLAQHYLTNSDLRTSEIAYLLGYDDASSFYRAFRGWTGSTPDSLRSRLRDGVDVGQPA